MTMRGRRKWDQDADADGASPASSLTRYGWILER
jgi:hypothetical protein